jgi:hypothetical protein
MRPHGGEYSISRADTADIRPPVRAAPPVDGAKAGCLLVLRR